MKNEKNVVLWWNERRRTERTTLHFITIVFVPSSSFIPHHSSFPSLFRLIYNGVKRKREINRNKERKERGVFLCALCFSFASHDFVLSLQIIEAKGTQRTKQRITGNRIVSDVVSFVLLLSLFMLQLQANRNKRVN